MILLWAAEAAAVAPPHPLLAEVVDVIAKLGVPLIGAVWVWHSYLRGRTFRRRLEPKITAEILQVDDLHFLSVVSSVKNVGLSRAFILQRGTWIELYRLQTDRSTEGHADPNRKEIGFPPVFRKHAWVEPGEEVHDTRMVQLPRKAVEDVAIELRLRVISDEFAIPWKKMFSDQPPDLLKEDLGKLYRRDLQWSAACIVPFPPPVRPDEITRVPNVELNGAVHTRSTV